jgi:hypothetical protein
VLKQTDTADLLSKAFSCGNWGYGNTTAAQPHCGYCSQCIDRRFATIAADVEAHDPESRYKHDVFLDPPKNDQAALLGLGYVRFAQRVVDMTDRQLIARYPQIIEAVLPGDPDPDTTMREYIDLTRRHAETVLRVMEVQRDIARPLFSRSKVAITSLLMLSASDPSLTLESEPLPDEIPLSRPATPIRPIAESVDATGNTLVYRDGEWEVSYRGSTITLNHSERVMRLAFLLDHPGERFTPEELLAQTGTDAAVHGEASPERARSRKQNAVYQSLYRIRKAIELDHPPLGKHLHGSLTFGERFAYLPEGDVPWHVVLPPKAA